MRILYQPNQYTQQRQREYKRWIYPVLLAMEAEYHRQQGHTVVWEGEGTFNKTYSDPIGIDFLSLPAPDRVFTKAMDKKYQNNGNFKYLPGTYMQVASSCWWRKCTFCKETKDNRPYQVRDLDSVMREIESCKKLGFKEIFDDSGTFPTGDWLKDFCKEVKKYDIKLGCNMRLVDLDWKMMKQAGFRMVLFGIESANQETLDRLNKGVKIEKAEGILKEASKAGLEPHLAIMLGYSCETRGDTNRTLRFTKEMLCRGYASTAQASVYDVLGSEANLGNGRLIKDIYKVGYSPRFWYQQIKRCKTKADWQYLLRGIRRGLNDN